MKTTEISNSQDIIDSRDIIARIDHLLGELDTLTEAVSDAETPEDKETAREALADWLGCIATIFRKTFPKA